MDVARTNLNTVQKWAQEIGQKVVTTCSNIDLELPYENAFFDAAVIIATLEFVFNPLQVLKEAFRVLEVNGILVIQVGNIASLKNRLRLLAGVCPHTTKFAGSANGGALHFFTLSSLKELAFEAGFAVTYAHCSGRLYEFKNLYCELLSNDLILVLSKRSE